MTIAHHTEFKIDAKDPLAEVAESLVFHWKSKWLSVPSGLVYVPFLQFTPLVAHLRRRILRLDSVQVPSPGPSALLSQALSEGATLIAGGQEIEPSYWEPMLFVNIPSDSCLFSAAHVLGPRLLVIRSSDGNNIPSS